MENQTVTFIDQKKKKFNLVRGQDGSRRLRGSASVKHLPDNFMPRDAALSEDCGEFGDTYSVKVLGDEDALPSIKLVLDGLQKDYLEMIRDLSDNISNEGVKNMEKFTQAVKDFFIFLYDLLKGEDVDEPLTTDELWNPENIFVKILFYLYSMEPPLYGQLSKASREMNMRKLDTLGPFARTLLEVLGGGNNIDKKRKDTLMRGKENGSKGPLGHFSQCFIVFRGVKMVDDELFDYYKNKLGRSVNVSGTTSTSSKLSVALDQSRCGKMYKN